MPFIVLEGPDGSGKTSQTQLLAEKLKDYGLQVYTYHEPGGTAAGEILNKLIKDASIPLDSYAQLFTVFAARAQLVTERLSEHLRRDDWVILDRYLPSTIAYRPDIPRGFINDLTRRMRFPQPDLYVFLDAPEYVLRRRLADSRGDRFDLDENFHRRCGLYKNLCRQFGGRPIDTNRPKPVVSDDVFSIILSEFDLDA